MIEDDTPRPAGVFDAGGRRDVVRLGEPVQPGAVARSRSSDEGGVDAPTSDAALLRADLIGTIRHGPSRFRRGPGSAVRLALDSSA